LSILWWKFYNCYIFDFLIHYSKLHPLDLFHFTQEYIFDKPELSSPILSLTQERIQTKKNGDIFFKRYTWYLFEWHTFISDETNIKPPWETWIAIDSFQSHISTWLGSLYDSLYSDISMPKSAEEIERHKKTKDDFYNNVFIAMYHQETTHEPIFLRMVSIFNILRDNFKDKELLERYMIILFSLTNYSYYKWKYIFNLDKFLNEGLKETSITKNNIIEFLNYIGVTTYSEYVGKVKHRTIDTYFPKKKVYNVVNIPLEIHETPFIDISDEIHKDGYYFFDETFLLKKFYTTLGNFAIDDTWQDWDFWHIMEKYICEYSKRWLADDSSKLSSENYVVEYWVEFGGNSPWEIDLFIYNKETKNLIIFESKDHLQLNEQLFSVWEVANLTKKMIHWRKTPWNIYKWISQLLKHSLRNKETIWSKILDGVEINNIEYVFLNHHNSMLWNEVMRYFLQDNSEFEDLKFHFMSLNEFERLISIWCQEGKDFFDIINEKSENFDSNKSYRIILERFKAFSSQSEDYSTEYIDTINQDFTTFFYTNYWDVALDSHPFAKSSFLSYIFK